MTNYKFITFEGIEGCGKSTQSKKLYEYFLAKQIKSIHTREPGGTIVGEKIREILLSENLDKLTAITELMLNFASRTEHVDKLIKPALRDNKMVICDRFIDSTMAYQGKAMGIGYEKILQISKICLDDFAPDITFLIDITLDESIARTATRKDNNKYEKLSRNFHEKVREGFFEIAKNNSRIKIIDGMQNPQQVFQQIIQFFN